MLKGELAVGRLDLFERAELLQPKVHEVQMDGDGKAARPEHLHKKILQTLFGRIRSGQRLIDAAHPSHFHPCDFLAARFQLGPCVFCCTCLPTP